MVKLSINLLPAEYAVAYSSSERFQKIQRIGIGILVLLIFFSSLTFALSLMQNSNILQAKANLQTAESVVGQFKSQEESLVLLKDRLNNLQRISSTPSRSNTMYNLIASLMPTSIVPTLIVTDTFGNISLTIVTVSSTDIDDFITILTDPQKNQGLVSKVYIESLSRGKDGIYRVNLKIYTK